MPRNVHLEQKSRQNMWPLKSVAKPAMISQNFAAKKRQRRHQWASRQTPTWMSWGSCVIAAGAWDHICLRNDRTGGSYDSNFALHQSFFKGFFFHNPIRIWINTLHWLKSRFNLNFQMMTIKQWWVGIPVPAHSQEWKQLIPVPESKRECFFYSFAGPESWEYFYSCARIVGLDFSFPSRFRILEISLFPYLVYGEVFAFLSRSRICHFISGNGKEMEGHEWY